MQRHGSYEVRAISRRVFSGSASEVHRRGRKTSYPKIDEVYIDHDGRRQLGIEQPNPTEPYPGSKGPEPVAVGPDVRRLFTGRLLLYGATLFLGALALFEILKEGLTGIAIATILLSLLITIVLVLVDIRSRVRY